MQTLNDEEKEKCKTLWAVWSAVWKLKPQQSEPILCLQYCTLRGEQSENA